MGRPEDNGDPYNPASRAYIGHAAEEAEMTTRMEWPDEPADLSQEIRLEPEVAQAPRDQPVTPRFCPRCGGGCLERFLRVWRGWEETDKPKEIGRLLAEMDEHHCNDCGLRFWT